MPCFRYDTEGTHYTQMSLKAKLEAVIYAAEEPVSLAQLAVIFADEAFAYREEQEAARLEAEGTAQAVPLPLESGEESPAGEGFDPVEAEAGVAAAATIAQAVAVAGEAVSGAETEATPVAEDDATSENGMNSVEESGAETEAANVASAEATPVAEAKAPEMTAEELELEARRQARQRDREVRAILRELLDEIIAHYASDDRGVEIREIAGGFRMATKPECHDAVRLFIKSLKPALKLSLPALETLAVIAYKQPITAPEVNEIRGVDSSGVFGSLLARKLIATAGRKQVIGRPILYKTTKEFLMRFGLKDIGELPSMEEFEKLAVSELEESEAPETTEGNGVEPGVAPEGQNEGVVDDASKPAGDAQEADSATTAAPAEAGSTADKAEETIPEAANDPDGTEKEAAIATEEAEPDAPAPNQQAEIEQFPHDNDEEIDEQENGRDGREDDQSREDREDGKGSESSEGSEDTQGQGREGGEGSRTEGQEALDA